MKFPKFSAQAIQLTIVVLGFGWGVYTFVWQQYIAKLLEPPRVEIAPQIDDVGLVKDGLNLIRLDFKVVNPNLRVVHVNNSRWALYALRRRTDGVQQSFGDRLKTFNRDPDSRKHVELTSIVSRGQLLAVGTLFAHASLPSGYSRKESILVEIPRNVKELNLEVFFPHSFHKTVSDFGYSYRLSESGELLALFCPGHVQGNLSSSRVDRCISFDSDRHGASGSKGFHFLNFDASFALQANPS